FMKQVITQSLKLAMAGVLLLPAMASAQCELFKSEVWEVKDYSEAVSVHSDSVRTYAEIAGYADTFSTARENARIAQKYAGEAQAAAHEAVTLAADAQYYAEVCGIDAVITNSIEAESRAIDARDFADVAMSNAKKASAARKLGDVHYHMRKSLNAAREAQKSATAAVYAASDAHYSCTHDDAPSTGKGE
ncbi:hypothetical protein, partial [Robiginitalea sp.]|uniref:hypothetical protein n=2 Tax=Robiginitalea sp. TaxID=1902411 RepID=UPI003C7831FF